MGASQQTLEETAQRIKDRLTLNITGNQDLKVAVTCSIGIAVYPRDGLDASSLFKHADKAMYKAKERGKNAYCFASILPENT
jgi:diguanylate cyclase (GGDEF)-like protein